MDEKIVYLMRGLPACGKSYKAKQLAGADGTICETDEFFFTQVGDDPTRYDYSNELLPTARQWNFERFCLAVEHGVGNIVVDRGNGLNAETRRYAAHAVNHGYKVELAEPDSSWWQELRVLLKYMEYVDDKLLDAWAEKLADATRNHHRVPAAVIRHWMTNWQYDLTVKQILSLEEC